MKTKHIFWGVLFITIGILVLINNFTGMYYDWDAIWRFWPLVLVLGGISIMIKNDVIKSIISAFTAIVLALVLFASFKTVTGFVHNGIEFVSDDEYDGESEVTYYSEPFKDSIEEAELHINAGAGSFVIIDTTSELVNARAEGVKNTYTLSSGIRGALANVDLEMEKARFRIGKGKIKNKLDIQMNPNPVWDLNFDIGAAAADFDLSKFKVKDVNIKMGAASLDLTLGNLQDSAYVDIDAGASSIRIDIPEEAACEIRTDVSLSSKDFEGFTKIKDDLYRTSNFDSAAKKIFINLETGIASIHVTRSGW